MSMILNKSDQFINSRIRKKHSYISQSYLHTGRLTPFVLIPSFSLLKKSFVVENIVVKNPRRVIPICFYMVHANCDSSSKNLRSIVNVMATKSIIGYYYAKVIFPASDVFWRGGASIRRAGSQTYISPYPPPRQSRGGGWSLIYIYGRGGKSPCAASLHSKAFPSGKAFYIRLYSIGEACAPVGGNPQCRVGATIPLKGTPPVGDAPRGAPPQGFTAGSVCMRGLANFVPRQVSPRLEGSASAWSVPTMQARDANFPKEVGEIGEVFPRTRRFFLQRKRKTLFDSRWTRGLYIYMAAKGELKTCVAYSSVADRSFCKLEPFPDSASIKGSNRSFLTLVCRSHGQEGQHHRVVTVPINLNKTHLPPSMGRDIKLKKTPFLFSIHMGSNNQKNRKEMSGKDIKSLNKKYGKNFVSSLLLIINYKKPFLCYWFLPFLGLINGLTPFLIKNNLFNDFDAVIQNKVSILHLKNTFSNDFNLPVLENLSFIDQKKSLFYSNKLESEIYKKLLESLFLSILNLQKEEFYNKTLNQKTLDSIESSPKQPMERGKKLPQHLNAWSVPTMQSPLDPPADIYIYKPREGVEAYKSIWPRGKCRYPDQLVTELQVLHQPTSRIWFESSPRVIYENQELNGLSRDRGINLNRVKYSDQINLNLSSFSLIVFNKKIKIESKFNHYWYALNNQVNSKANLLFPNKLFYIKKNQWNFRLDKKDLKEKIQAFKIFPPFKLEAYASAPLPHRPSHNLPGLLHYPRSGLGEATPRLGFFTPRISGGLNTSSTCDTGVKGKGMVFYGSRSEYSYKKASLLIDKALFKRNFVRIDKKQEKITNFLNVLLETKVSFLNQVGLFNLNISKNNFFIKNLKENQHTNLTYLDQSKIESFNKKLNLIIRKLKSFPRKEVLLSLESLTSMRTSVNSFSPVASKLPPIEGEERQARHSLPQGVAAETLLVPGWSSPTMQVPLPAPPSPNPPRGLKTSAAGEARGKCRCTPQMQVPEWSVPQELLIADSVEIKALDAMLPLDEKNVNSSKKINNSLSTIELYNCIFKSFKNRFKPIFSYPDFIFYMTSHSRLKYMESRLRGGGRITCLDSENSVSLPYSSKNSFFSCFKIRNQKIFTKKKYSSYLFKETDKKKSFYRSSINNMQTKKFLLTLKNKKTWKTLELFENNDMINKLKKTNVFKTNQQNRENQNYYILKNKDQITTQLKTNFEANILRLNHPIRGGNLKTLTSLIRKKNFDPEKISFSEKNKSSIFFNDFNFSSIININQNHFFQKKNPYPITGGITHKRGEASIYPPPVGGEDAPTGEMQVPAWSVPTMQVPPLTPRGDSVSETLLLQGDVYAAPPNPAQVGEFLGDFIGHEKPDLLKKTCKNSLISLSNYIKVITNKIKTRLLVTRYKFRLTYLTELNISNNYRITNFRAKSFLSFRHFFNYGSKKVGSETARPRGVIPIKPSTRGSLHGAHRILPTATKEEKLFLSYLSRAKKTFSNSEKTITIAKKKNSLTKFKNLKVRTLSSMMPLKMYNSNRTLQFTNKDETLLIYNLPKHSVSAGSAPAMQVQSLKLSNDLNMHSDLVNKKKIKKKFKIKKISPKIKLFLSKQINLLNSDINKISKNEQELKNASLSVFFKYQKKKQKSNFFSYKNLLDTLSKKKNLKIKRRLKKMKKETRRRKKRKIFYPRPSWIAFYLYKNFLDTRYISPSIKKTPFWETYPRMAGSQGATEVCDPSPLTSAALVGGVPAWSVPSMQVSASSPNPLSGLRGVGAELASPPRLRNKVEGGGGLYIYMAAGKIQVSPSSPPRQGGHPLQASRNGGYPTLFIGGQGNLQEASDFYKISNLVVIDLKKFLVKSNWIQTNLNPYLEKITNIYQEMQNSSKKTEIYSKLRNFILNFFGSSSYAQPYSFFDTEKKVFNDFNSIFLSNWHDKKVIFTQNNFAAQVYVSPLSNNLKREKQSQIQKTFNLLEYNRLVYQRIQRIILSIKDNLNLKGEIKYTSKKLGKNIRAFLKREYKENNNLQETTETPNFSKFLWTKLIKNNIIKLNSLISYSYDQPLNIYSMLNLSRNNLFWAMNKSNIILISGLNDIKQTEKIYSYPKKIWNIYKIREISNSASNKTKKIILKFLMKFGFQSGLSFNSFYSFSPLQASPRGGPQNGIWGGHLHGGCRPCRYPVGVPASIYPPPVGGGDAPTVEMLMPARSAPTMQVGHYPLPPQGGADVRGLEGQEVGRLTWSQHIDQLPTWVSLPRYGGFGGLFQSHPVVPAWTVPTMQVRSQDNILKLKQDQKEIPLTDDHNNLNLFDLTSYIQKSQEKLVTIETKLKLLGLYSNRIENTYKNSYFRYLRQQYPLNSKFFNNFSYKKSQFPYENDELHRDASPPSRGENLYIEALRKGTRPRHGYFLRRGRCRHPAGENAGAPPKSFFPPREMKNLRGGFMVDSATQSNINAVQSINKEKSIWAGASNFIYTDLLNFSQVKKFSDNYLYWWTCVSKIQNSAAAPNFDKSVIFKPAQSFFEIKPLYTCLFIISFLFHFASLVSFISLGGIRTLIKFYFILFSKISKIIFFVKKSLFFEQKSRGWFTRQNYGTYPQHLSPPLTEKFSLKKLFKNQHKVKKQLNILDSNLLQRSKNIIDKKISFRLTLSKFVFLESINLKIKGNRTCMDRTDHAGTWESHLKSIPKDLLFQKEQKESFCSFVPRKFLSTQGPFKEETKLRQAGGFDATGVAYAPKLPPLSSLIYPSRLESGGDVPVWSAPTMQVPPPNAGAPPKFFIPGTPPSQVGSWKVYEKAWPLRLDRNMRISPLSGTQAFYGWRGSFTAKAYSRSFIIFYTRFMSRFSFYIYFGLLKSVSILEASISFIYKFFEKPGEYVVENLAYNFLVEWSADLITTIPETVDINSNTYFLKLNKTLVPNFTFPLFYLGGVPAWSVPTMQVPPYPSGNGILQTSASAPAEGGFMDLHVFETLKPNGASSLDKNFYDYLNILNFLKYFFFPFVFALSNSIFKRLLSSTFLVFVQQLCEPDLDYINRKKKGVLFWDIWGEYLKQIAEENSINIYELTTDKEEQIKLLSKYQEKSKDVNLLTYSWISRRDVPAWSAPTMQVPASIYPTPVGGGDAPTGEMHKKLRGGPKSSSCGIEVSYFKRNVNQALGRKNRSLYLPSKWVEPKDSKNKKTDIVSQFLSYQGKDTDLFIDLNLTKSFSSIPSIKYSFSVQQPIGLIVCQIFSGIFYKQISKNILVIGSSNLEKSLLIEAMAGEAELKIITDNANRYAMIYRGIAVGIKLLKDVFEALSLHTPCIFLIQDIHIIGERRPFLIDTDGSSPTDDASYNKNQSMQSLLLKEKTSAISMSREMLYKNSKHLLSYYKKPYKESRSLAANHFSFNFLFSMKKTRKHMLNTASLVTQILKKETKRPFFNGASNNNWNFSLKFKPNINRSISFSFGSPWKRVGSENLINFSFNDKKQSLTNFYSSSLKKGHFSLVDDSQPEGGSRQGMNKEKKKKTNSLPLSPFSVLILKEEKKLKYKKTVKEIPWFGLPGEQFSLISKTNYSIRVKIALLADLVLSNLSVKLDMITDLLVIIDSVKGNRGFIVFATTHIPYILDPALRRPGRFDETISMPLIPTLFTRWSNYNYNVKYLSNWLFNKYSIPLTSSFNKGISINLFNYNLIDQLSLVEMTGALNNSDDILIKHSTNFTHRLGEGNSVWGGHLQWRSLLRGKCRHPYGASPPPTGGRYIDAGTHSQKIEITPRVAYTDKSQHGFMVGLSSDGVWLRGKGNGEDLAFPNAEWREGQWPRRAGGVPASGGSTSIYPYGVNTGNSSPPRGGSFPSPPVGGGYTSFPYIYTRRLRRAPGGDGGLYIYMAAGEMQGTISSNPPRMKKYLRANSVQEKATSPGKSSFISFFKHFAKKIYYNQNNFDYIYNKDSLRQRSDSKNFIGNSISNKQLLKLKSRNYSFACKSLISLLFFFSDTTHSQPCQINQQFYTTLPKVTNLRGPDDLDEHINFNLKNEKLFNSKNPFIKNLLPRGRSLKVLSSLKSLKSLKWLNFLKDYNLFGLNQDYSTYFSLFGYPVMLKIILMGLLGGKIGEYFIFRRYQNQKFQTCSPKFFYPIAQPLPSLYDVEATPQVPAWSIPSMQVHPEDIFDVFYGGSAHQRGGTPNLPGISPAIGIQEKIEKSSFFKKQGLDLSFDNSFLFYSDSTWKLASSLLISYLQKRLSSTLGPKLNTYTRLLSFNNKYSLMQAPIPPLSNVLLPSKRFENYKKTFNSEYNSINNENTFHNSIAQKVEFHQKQRLLRRLYKYPIKEFFRSEILNPKSNFILPRQVFSGEVPLTSSNYPYLHDRYRPCRYNTKTYRKYYLDKNKKSKFNVFNTSDLNKLEKSSLTSFNIGVSYLSPLEQNDPIGPKLIKLSSINWCYKNLLYNRHRTHLINQWWNSQQGEHNVETTFLSDIDWRYTFIQSSKGANDINVDFPDSEQFYNPRNRRWFLTYKDWNYWFNTQSELKNVYNHYIYDCFAKTFRYLNQNREIIDFYSELLYQRSDSTGLNEKELLNLYKRFFHF